MPDDIMPEAVEAARLITFDEQYLLLPKPTGERERALAYLIQSTTRLKELREIAEGMAFNPFRLHPDREWYCIFCGHKAPEDNAEGTDEDHEESCPVTRLAALRKEG